MPCPSRDELLAWVHQAGDEMIDKHVESCETCATVVREIQEQESFLGEFLELEDLGSTKLPEVPDLPEETVPGYEIEDELARGGQGIVYRARQLSTERLVALKILRSSVFDDSVAHGRFQREIRAIARLRHPGIVTIYDAGVTSLGRPGYTMELIDGEPLVDRIPEGGYPPDRALELIRQIGDAVAHAHEHGIVHRDLNPKNILIDRDGQAHVLDFGLAKLTKSAIEPGLTHPGMFAGTLTFAAPEQVEPSFGPIDPRTDLYALGLILYSLLTGESMQPCDASIASIIHHITSVPPPSLRLTRPDAPEEAQWMLDAALAKRSADRPNSVREWLARWSPLSATEPAEPRVRKGFSIRGALLAALGLLASVTTWIALDRGSGSEEGGSSSALPEPMSLVRAGQEDLPRSRLASDNPTEQLWADLLFSPGSTTAQPIGLFSLGVRARSAAWKLWNSYRLNPIRLIADASWDEPLVDCRFVDWDGTSAVRVITAKGRTGTWSMEGRLLQETPPSGDWLLTSPIPGTELSFARPAHPVDESVPAQIQEHSLVDLQGGRFTLLASIGALPIETAQTNPLRTAIRREGGWCLFAAVDDRAWSSCHPSSPSSGLPAEDTNLWRSLDQASTFLTIRNETLTRVDIDVSGEETEIRYTPLVDPSGERVGVVEYWPIGQKGRLIYSRSFKDPQQRIHIARIEGEQLVPELSAFLPVPNLAKLSRTDAEGRWLALLGKSSPDVDLYRVGRPPDPVMRHSTVSSPYPAPSRCVDLLERPSNDLWAIGDSEGRLLLADVAPRFHHSLRLPVEAPSLEWLSLDETGLIVSGNLGRKASGICFLLTPELEIVQQPREIVVDPTSGSTRAAIRLPDGRILKGSDDSELRLTSSRGQTTRFRKEPLGRVNWIGLSPNRRLVAWSAQSLDTVWLGPADDPESALPLTSRLTSRVPRAVFGPAGRLLAAGDRRGNLSIWRLTDPTRPEAELIETFRAHGKALRVLRFTPDGRWLLTAGDDRKIHVFDFPNGLAIQKEPARTFSHPLDRSAPHAGREVFSLALHPSATVFAIGDVEGRIYLLDFETGEELAAFPQVGGHVMGLEFSADGRYLFAVCDEGSVHRWDLSAFDLHLARGLLFWGDRLEAKDPALVIPTSWRAWAGRRSAADR